MSADLASEKCVACRPDSPRVNEHETKELLPLIPAWTMVLLDGMYRLHRVYKFKDFVSALNFTNMVGRIAEEAQHHPLIITEWGQTTVQWWTHSIGGLHRNDFIMAARTDRLT
jgi:4a-hydroxytetrahydrobiopterin dehydratase